MEQIGQLIELLHVGDFERALYGKQGLAKFSDAAENGDREILYGESGAVIYAWTGGDDATVTMDEAGYMSEEPGFGLTATESAGGGRAHHVVHRRGGCFP